MTSVMCLRHDKYGINIMIRQTSRRTMIYNIKVVYAILLLRTDNWARVKQNWKVYKLTNFLKWSVYYFSDEFHTIRFTFYIYVYIYYILFESEVNSWDISDLMKTNNTCYELNSMEVILSLICQILPTNTKPTCYQQPMFPILGC